MGDINIHFHNYQTHKSRTGALYYNSEITQLLLNLPTNRFNHYDVRPHSLYQWLRMSDKTLFFEIKDIKKRDILVSNIGPHAYLYCYLREKFNLDFKIIRDNRTSFWIGYFLQEMLSAPFTRDTDLVLFPSEFTRQLFLHLFPNSLNWGNTAVSYPLASFFPQKSLTMKDTRNQPYTTLGYVGRMSDAKNFNTLLDIFVNLRKTCGKRYKLRLLGEFDKYSKFKKFTEVLNFLREFSISDNDISYNGFVSYKDIWKFYDSIDILLFPSTASVESLGRVIIEASHCNIPVIAGHFAASPEIIPIDNLVPFEPRYNTDFSMMRPCPLGRVDIDSAIQKIACQTEMPVAQIPPQYYKEYFYSLIEGMREEGKSLTDPLYSFIQGVKILTNYINISEDKNAAFKLSAQLWEFMSMYVGISPVKRAKIFFQLMCRSHMRLETFLNFLFVCMHPGFFILHSHIHEICNYFGLDVKFRLTNINGSNEKITHMEPLPFF